MSAKQNVQRDPEGHEMPSSVSDLMQTDVMGISPTASLRQLAGLLWRNGISGVPVVDDEGTVVGTVGISDLTWVAGLFAEDDVDPKAADELDERTVRDIMTPDVFGVGPAASLAELADFFARTGLRRAVVLEDGQLAGIVSVTDLLGLIVDDAE